MAADAGTGLSIGLGSGLEGQADDERKGRPAVPTTTPSERVADLRTEYAALAAGMNTISTLRFQTLAALLVAIGWVAGHQTKSNASLLIVIALAAGVIDQRSRQVLNQHRARGRRIETEWGRTKAEDSFFMGRDRHERPWLFVRSKFTTIPLPRRVLPLILHTL
jgi:hypothetical protein